MRNKDTPKLILVPRHLIISLAVAFVSMLLMTILSLQYANWIDRRSNQRWCGIVTLFNNSYAENPPTRPIGRQLAFEMHKLQQEFKCPNK